jgi:hypothetical protein
MRNAKGGMVEDGEREAGGKERGVGVKYLYISIYLLING